MLIRHPKPEMGTEEKALTRRIIAIALDEIILMVTVAILLFIVFIKDPSIFSSMEEFLSLFALPAIFGEFFYFIFLEGFMGQTIGKKIMKIVVVKEDGSPCTYTASLIRNLLRVIIDSHFNRTYLVGGITIFLTKKKQRIGDLVAKTVVVKIAQEGQ